MDDGNNRHGSLGELVTPAIPQSDWREYFRWMVGKRRRFVVRENSMVPTLMPGDTILAELAGGVQVGDIAVVCWSHTTPPRVLNAQPYAQGVMGDGTSKPTSLLLVKRVKEVFCDGSVYLISDNAHAPNVRDSRHFGVISASHVVGRITSRLASSPS